MRDSSWSQITQDSKSLEKLLPHLTSMGGSSSSSGNGSHNTDNGSSGNGVAAHGNGADGGSHAAGSAPVSSPVMWHVCLREAVLSNDELSYQTMNARRTPL
jgi:hypothetical protein